MQAIGRAFLVIADISGEGRDRFNLDVCIKAGMAIAAGGNLELMAAGDPRGRPFMLRGAGQLATCGGPVDQLGRVRNIAWSCGLHVINAEL